MKGKRLVAVLIACAIGSGAGCSGSGAMVAVGGTLAVLGGAVMLNKQEMEPCDRRIPFDCAENAGREIGNGTTTLMGVGLLLLATGFLVAGVVGMSETSAAEARAGTSMPPAQQQARTATSAAIATAAMNATSTGAASVNVNAASVNVNAASVNVNAASVNVNAASVNVNAANVNAANVNAANVNVGAASVNVNAASTGAQSPAPQSPAPISSSPQSAATLEEARAERGRSASKLALHIRLTARADRCEAARTMLSRLMAFDAELGRALVSGDEHVARCRATMPPPAQRQQAAPPAP